MRTGLLLPILRQNGLERKLENRTLVGPPYPVESGVV